MLAASGEAIKCLSLPLNPVMGSGSPDGSSGDEQCAAAKLAYAGLGAGLGPGQVPAIGGAEAGQQCPHKLTGMSGVATPLGVQP